MFMLAETEKAEAAKPVPPPPADLLERGEMRVSHLTGGRVPGAPGKPHKVLPGRMTLDWYDWSVVVLIVASLVAGIFCVVRGL